MSLQSIASTLPGMWSWVKNTCLPGSFSGRQFRTRRWKVRKCLFSTLPPPDRVAYIKC